MPLSRAKEVPWWNIRRTCQIYLDVPIEWHTLVIHYSGMHLVHSKEHTKGLVERHLFGPLQRIPIWAIRRTLWFEKKCCWGVWSKDRDRGSKKKVEMTKATCWPSPMRCQVQPWYTGHNTPKLLHNSPATLPLFLHQFCIQILPLESYKNIIPFLFKLFVFPPKTSAKISYKYEPPP